MISSARHARAVALLATAATAGPLAAQQRPNIVFLFSDDHAAHAVSAYRTLLQYGAHLPATPGIDRLAREGMLFLNAFVTNSICGPSRATVLTGQYGHLNGVMINGQPLDHRAITFPELLQDAGYVTVLFGKWHLGTEPEGFDHFEILAGQGPYYNPVLYSGSEAEAEAEPRTKRTLDPDPVQYQGYTPDIITRRALDWLDTREAEDAPFLLMLHYNAAHRWWDPGPDQLALYLDTVLPEPATLWDDHSGHTSSSRVQEMTIAHDLFARDLKLEPPSGLMPVQLEAWNATYAAENAALREAEPTGAALTRWRYQRFIKDYMRTVDALDDNVRRVLEHLDRAGLAGNTVVVYTSDQGFFLGDHGWFDKRWMYEESLRTPLIVRWPGTVPASSVNRDLVMNLDLAETLLDIGGARVPATMQGHSLLPLLRGRSPEDWRDEIYYQYFEYPGWHMVRRQYGVRTHRFKLIHFYEVGEWELFDLARDPNELVSVYDDPAYADVRADLHARHSALRAEYGVPDVDPVPHTPFDPPPELRRPAGLLPDTTRHNPQPPTPNP
ncbi:MAG: sulfatase family protein [Longimicrobiales bacterium]